VQRWVKFAKYLPSEGWEPVVYTPENPEITAVDRTLEKEISPNLEVIKRPITEPYDLYRKLMGKGAETDLQKLTAAGSKDEVTPISSGKKSFRQRLSLWIRGNIFVPDPRVSWVKPSVKFLKKYLKEHPVDVIVTTGPPQSMHLIGLKLHKDLGLPWIPDFRDPWTKMYYLKHLPLTAATKKALYRMEQKVLDSCSTVLTVTPMVQEDYAARTKTPVAMITNGYDEEDFSGVGTGKTSGFVITHTGLLASDGNPETLWKTLGEMASANPDFKRELRLRLIGRVDRAVQDSIDAAGLAENTELPGYLDHSATNREQCDAGMLILPLRNDPDYAIILPGKLFEYLASRRPVLGIGQEDGAMARVLTEAGAGVTADWNNAEKMRAFILQAWESHKKGGIPATEGKIEKYSRRSITRQLAELLEKVS